MNITSVLIFLVATVIFIFAIDTFMRVFFVKRKTSTKVLVLSYFVYSVLALSNTFMLLDAHLSHPILMGIAYFIISLNFEATMVKRLVSVTSLYLLAATMEMLMMSFLWLFILTPLGIPVENFIGNFDAVIKYTLPIHLIFYGLTRLLKRFRNIKKSIHLPAFWGGVLFTQLTIIVAMFTALFWLPLNTFINGLILFIYNLSILYIYNTISETYDKNLKIALHTQEKEYYLSQSEMMNKSVEQMKAFKHDIRNHLITLRTYVEQGNSLATFDYFDQLLGEIEVDELYSDTGNTPVDSIINYKFRNARQNQIRLSLNLSIPRDLPIEASAIVKLLGNLLDNALEAVEKINEKWISLDIEFSRGCLFIKIENSFNGEVVYSEENQMVSSKGNDEHGYGLKNISQTINDYNGEIKVSHADQLFSVVVLLYVGDVTNSNHHN